MVSIIAPFLGCLLHLHGCSCKAREVEDWEAGFIQGLSRLSQFVYFRNLRNIP